MDVPIYFILRGIDHGIWFDLVRTPSRCTLPIDSCRSVLIGYRGCKTVLQLDRTFDICIVTAADSD